MRIPLLTALLALPAFADSFAFIGTEASSTARLRLNGSIILDAYPSPNFENHYMGIVREDDSNSLGAAWLSNYPGNGIRQFFVFDLVGIDVPITSASFGIGCNGGCFGYGRFAINWTLWDITSGFERVGDFHAVLEPGFYKDAGGGILYGKSLWHFWHDPIDIYNYSCCGITMNDAALAQINSGQRYFMFGGSILGVPEPSALALLALPAMASLRRRRRHLH